MLDIENSLGDKDDFQPIGLLAIAFVVSWLILAGFIFNNFFAGIVCSSFHQLAVKEKEAANTLQSQVQQQQQQQQQQRQHQQQQQHHQQLQLQQLQPQQPQKSQLNADAADVDDRGRSSAETLLKVVTSFAGPPRSSEGGGRSAETLPKVVTSFAGSPMSSEGGGRSVETLPKVVASFAGSPMSSDGGGAGGNVEEDMEQWETIVERRLLDLMRDPSEFRWPSDTLFRYLVLMEALLENLHERRELLRLAAQALYNIADS